MKAKSIKFRLSKNEQRQLDEYAQRQAYLIAEKSLSLGISNIFLQTIYLFYDVYGFRAKRLKRLCDQLMAQKVELDKLYNEQTMVAMMIERMKSCGADFTPTFQDLLDNEEERFNKIKEKEYGKRCAGK